MSAEFGTRGVTHVTSIVSGPTSPNLRSVGAGTAEERREKNDNQNVIKDEITEN